MSERLSDEDLRRLADSHGSTIAVRLARELVEAREHIADLDKQLADVRKMWTASFDMRTPLYEQIERLDNALRWIAAAAYRSFFTMETSGSGTVVREFVRAAGYAPKGTDKA